MIKTKTCIYCNITFTNQRKNGGVLGDKQFSKARFCSLKCSGKSQKGIPKKKHTEEWKHQMSKRMKKEHALGLRKNIFTLEVRAKMSISAKNKPPMTKETREKIGQAHTGEKNYAWKGDAVGYHGLHQWVIKQLGSPMKCANCLTTTAKKFEWCSINHEYKRELSNWVRLCTRCHRNYDFGNITLIWLDKPTELHSISDDSQIYLSK